MSRKPINETFYWSEKPETTFVNELNNAYDNIVYWRKKIPLRTGAAGKSFITVMTRMISTWVYDPLIRDIALKTLYVMPVLLLQKPSKNCQSKDHQISPIQRNQMKAQTI